MHLLISPIQKEQCISFGPSNMYADILGGKGRAWSDYRVFEKQVIVVGNSVKLSCSNISKSI